MLQSQDQHEQEECELFTEHQLFDINSRQENQIKHVGRTTPNLVVSLSSNRAQTYVRKYNTDICVKRMWLNVCAERSALFSPSH